MTHLKFILFVLCSLSIYTIQAQIPYKVKGHVDGLNNQMVAMVIAHGGEFTFETTKSNRSHFEFSGEVDQGKWVQMFTVEDGPEMKLGRKFAEFVLDTTIVSIEGSFKAAANIDVDASSTNRIAQIYFKEDQQLNNSWSKLNQERLQFLESSDSIQADSVRLLMNNILVDQKIPLLKNFVEDHSHLLVSAMVPHFVSFQRILKPIDYSEMYEFLDESIKSSSFGRLMLEKALVI